MEVDLMEVVAAVVMEVVIKCMKKISRECESSSKKTETVVVVFEQRNAHTVVVVDYFVQSHRSCVNHLRY